MDAWLLNVISNNWVTIYLILTLLKGVALATPWSQDDKIISLLSTAFAELRGVFKSGDTPKSIPGDTL